VAEASPPPLWSGIRQADQSEAGKPPTQVFDKPVGAKVYAVAASVIATGPLHGLTALEALRAALAGRPIMRSA